MNVFPVVFEPYDTSRLQQYIRSDTDTIPAEVDCNCEVPLTIEFCFCREDYVIDFIGKRLPVMDSLLVSDAA